MEACFCVEVITVNTCSLLSLIGLQLVLIVCERGLLLSPAEELSVSLTAGKSALWSSACTLQSSTLRPVWLAASEVHCGQFSQARRKGCLRLWSILLNQLSSTYGNSGKYGGDGWYKFSIIIYKGNKRNGSFAQSDILSNISCSPVSRDDRHWIHV